MLTPMTCALNRKFQSKGGFQKSDKYGSFGHVMFPIFCPHPCTHTTVLCRWSHSVEVLLGSQRLLLLFPLSQDRSSVLVELSQRRATLEGLKMVALPRPCPPQQVPHTEGVDTPPVQKHRTPEGNAPGRGFFSVDLTPSCCSQVILDPETSAVAPAPESHTAAAGRWPVLFF